MRRYQFVAQTPQLKFLIEWPTERERRLERAIADHLEYTKHEISEAFISVDILKSEGVDTQWIDRRLRSIEKRMNRLRESLNKR